MPKRLRFVHATGDRPARVALVELRLARPGGLDVEPPLVEWSTPGVRGDEVSDVLAGRFGVAAGRDARCRARVSGTAAKAIE